MSRPLPIGMYHPGTSLLHRAPVGLKMLVLAVFSVAVVAIRDAQAAGWFLLGTLVVATIARVPIAATVRALRFVLVLAVIVGLFQWWLSGPEKAVESLIDLIALALAAIILTTTTAVNDMLDAIVRWIGPLRRFGIDPERVALTFSLAIRALPETIELATETRDAARARGLDRSPRAYLSPFVIRVVARAYETGDALQARGLGDEHH